MKNYLERANELKDEIVENRRYLHRHPEVGHNLPITTAYVMEKLTEMGYIPKLMDCSGIVATVGGKNGGKTILLRADMDALPMKEDSGLPFASEVDTAAHTCGHDTHTSMLLGAAKMLKERENELKGTVKLMFQPAEEILTGAISMINEGVLENPKVDVAMAMHIMATAPVGLLVYGVGPMAASSDIFSITINGRGGHGAMPQMTVDPINVGAHLHISLQELISREIAPSDTAVLTFGCFNAGDANNIIPERAVLEGTLRTYSAEVRNFLRGRLSEVTELTAKTFRAQASVDFKGSVPTLVCEADVTNTIAAALQELLGKNNVILQDIRISGSEDFAEISERVPTTFFALGGGSPEQGCSYGQHNPKVLFLEEALPIGAAAYAEGAEKWLEKNS